MGRIENLAKAMMQRATGSVLMAGTSVEVTNSDSPPVVASVVGRVAKVHKVYQDWEGMDTGAAVNSKVPYVGISEQLLEAAGFTVRNGAGEVDMRDWLVSWVDSTGVAGVYKVAEWHADETLGYLRVYVKGME